VLASFVAVPNAALDAAPQHRDQAPGFYRVKVGNLEVTALFDGHGVFDAGWLNGTVFNPLKWQSVAGNLAMASWSMNLVVWSLYAEVCAAPFLPLFHRLSRKANGWLDAATLLALIAVTLLSWGHLWSRYLFVFYLGMMVETRGLAWARLLERRLGGSRPAVAVIYVLMMLPNTFSAHRSPAVILVEAAGAKEFPGVVHRGG